MDKMIEEMAKDIQEATRRASQILVEETRAFVKANRHYHSKNDFDKAHPKTLAELEAEYLIEKGYTKQEWISVDERLPDEDDFYLCMSYCGCYEIYWFNTKHKLFNASDDSTEWAINVLYWMPLPTPPQMKGAE